MAEEEDGSNAFQYTPTWIVAVVCTVIVVISLAAERGLNRLGKCLKRKSQESLYEALQKIKEELMLLGFISLLLTVSQNFISYICIPAHLTLNMLPCAKEPAGSEGNTHNQHAVQHSLSIMQLDSEGENANYCARKGMVQFFSLEALHQLHIFIFIMAVVYVIFCATTMLLGGMKVRSWQRWEDSIQCEVSVSRNESNTGENIYARHLLEFFKRRKGDSTALSLLASFFKQFHGSVTKSDYIILRHGFIMAHCPSNPCFDFLNYMMRTLQYDFKKVVGVSWYLWAFVVLFLLVNLNGWRSYFWLSFLPLILLLIVGAKLEYIITCLAKEIEEKKRKNRTGQTTTECEEEKAPWVKPSDKHFWFGRPSIVLYLIHFILFQNSFENAFFIWVLLTYGHHSCVLEEISFVIPRLIVGVIVQVLCSYSTLPLYTIVTKMGSTIKEGNFDLKIHGIEDTWVGKTRETGRRQAIFGMEMQNRATESCEVVPASQETTVCVGGFATPETLSEHSCSV